MVVRRCHHELLWCVCKLKHQTNTWLCIHSGFEKEWFVNCHTPQVSTYILSETSPNRTCTSTQVAVADVAPTSAPRHAARVHTWLKAATEWVGGWWGVRMSV